MYFSFENPLNDCNYYTYSDIDNINLTFNMFHVAPYKIAYLERPLPSVSHEMYFEL